MMIERNGATTMNDDKKNRKTDARPIHTCQMPGCSYELRAPEFKYCSSCLLLRMLDYKGAR
jgi:hypothetical protein